LSESVEAKTTGNQLDYLDADNFQTLLCAIALDGLALTHAVAPLGRTD
jgi:hypothetical protein